MSQSLPMRPGIGYPADGQVELLRKLVWNTYYLAGGSGGGGVPAWVPAPASSGAAGLPGQMAIDDSYFYAYSAAAGQWLRTPMNDW